MSPAHWGIPWILKWPFWVIFPINPEYSYASHTDSWTDSLFFPFTYPWGLRDLFWLNQIFSGGRGLLSSLGIKESKASVFMEPAAAYIFKERFKAQKALWLLSTLSFISCLSLIISWPVRILGESYKWIIFPRQSYLWQESWFFFPSGCWHHAWVWSILSFWSFSLKNGLWPDVC